MSVLPTIGSCSLGTTFLHHSGLSELPSVICICRVSRHHYSRCFENFSTSRKLSPRFCSINSEGNAYGLSDSNKRTPNYEGSVEENETSHRSFKSNEMLKRLKRYGISGILSYGLLNTVYYIPTFLLVWFYVSPAPGKMGFLAAIERFFKVMAMVWAGSQVTKLARAGGAVALAPFVDRGLSWFSMKFKFDSQGKAFMAIVGFCFGLAIILFFAVTLLSM